MIQRKNLQSIYSASEKTDDYHTPYSTKRYPYRVNSHMSKSHAGLVDIRGWNYKEGIIRSNEGKLVSTCSLMDVEYETGQYQVLKR